MCDWIRIESLDNNDKLKIPPKLNQRKSLMKRGISGKYPGQW